MSIRTRFAPSPTGYLHIGSLRAALYPFLFAKNQGGTFILRVEDTDRQRLVNDAAEKLIEMLEWAGIQPDEGPTQGGDHGPYIQSERQANHHKYAAQLLKDKHAYKCFCSKERLDQLREDQKAAGQAPMYDKKCRHLSPEEIQAKLDAKIPYVVRQAIPENKTIEVKDLIRGKISFDTNTLDDHILLKTDGFPTYHLAAICDDIDMEITHVFRGEEWLPSAPKHILLFIALGAKPPKYGHLPLILGDNKKKLSKRTNDVNVESYIEQGFLKESIINYIALLGFNTGDGQEILSMDELIEKFDIKRVQKAGAIFDLDKFKWIDWQWKRKLYTEQIKNFARAIQADCVINENKKGAVNVSFNSDDKLLEFYYKKGNLLETYLTADIIRTLEENIADKNKLYQALVSLEEKVLKTPDQILEEIDLFFQTPNTENYNQDLFVHEKMQVTTDIARQALQALILHLKQEDFSSIDKLREKFITVIQELELKNGQVLWPTRVALSNKEYSPGAFELCYALGYEESLKRIQNAKLFLN